MWLCITRRRAAALCINGPTVLYFLVLLFSLSHITRKKKKGKENPSPNVVGVGERERKVWKPWSDVCLFSYLVIKAFIERTCFRKIKLGYPDMMDVRLTSRLTSEEPHVLDGSFLGSWPLAAVGGKKAGKCSLVFTQDAHAHTHTPGVTQANEVNQASMIHPPFEPPRLSARPLVSCSQWSARADPRPR